MGEEPVPLQSHMAFSFCPASTKTCGGAGGAALANQL